MLAMEMLSCSPENQTDVLQELIWMIMIVIFLFKGDTFFAWNLLAFHIMSTFEGDGLQDFLDGPTQDWSFETSELTF